MEKVNPNDAKQKILDKLIAFYKAQKLRLKAQEIQLGGAVTEENAAIRMIKGYNKNRHKIENKPKQDVSQAERRRRKLADLLSRSSSWTGLR